MPKTINVQITVKGIVLLLVAAALVYLIVVFDKILLLMFLAALLGVAIDPFVDRLENRRVPRAVAILITYLFLLGVLGAVFGLLVPVIASEFTQISASVPKITQQLANLPRSSLARRFPALANFLGSATLLDQIGGTLGGIAGGVGGGLVSLGKVLTTILISTFVVLVVGFFFAADARFAPRVIARFFPPSYRTTVSQLAREIGGRLGHWVRAQLLVGLFFGVTFGLGLSVLRVPNALSLGAAGAVLEIIPYVGGAIVTVIAMLVSITVAPWMPLAVLGLELVVANIESHVVYPKLVGNIVGLHPLTIIIALFIGAEAKGVMGAFLAVPVAVVLQVLFDHFYRFEEAQAAAAATETVPTTERAPLPRQTTEVVSTETVARG